MEWNPIKKNINERDLIMTDLFGNETEVYEMEGGTLSISQEDSGFVHIDRHELYNIIFNFINFDELHEISTQKMELQEEKFNEWLRKDTIEK